MTDADELAERLEAVRGALENLDLSADAEVADIARRVDALGAAADPLLDEALDRWLEADASAYFLISFALGPCRVLHRLVAKLEEQDDRFDDLLRLGAFALQGRLELEPRVDALLLALPDGSPWLEPLAEVFAGLTKEVAVRDLLAKTPESRAHAAQLVATLAPRHAVRQAPGIVDALARTSGAFGWNADCDAAATALERADADEVAASLVSFCNAGLPRDRYWRATPLLGASQLAAFVEEMSDTDEWARRAIAGMSDRGE